jgi:predicted PurR-regulated permease PerM
MSYLGRVALFVAVVCLAIAAWQISHVALLLFGGFIFAAILNAMAQRVRRFTPANQKVAVGVSVLALATTAAALLWLIGDSIAAQFDALRESLPKAVEALKNWLEDQPFGNQAIEVWDDAADGAIPWDRVAGAAGLTLGALGDLILMLLIGVFVAAQPQLYRDGFVRLASPTVRPNLAESLDDCATALADWLKGQAVSMLFVGIATGVGLALLGVPLALSLGLLAGLLDFVPLFGPIVAGVLAVLLAFTEGPQTALYVAALMLAIQQVEGNFLMPLVQRWAVHLPPMLGLISVVIFAAWFGIPGIIFASPLMVVVMVLVKRLYVQDFLEKGSSTKSAARSAS